MVQCLRTHLPKQGTRVQALVREDATCRGGAAKPVRHSSWGTSAPEPCCTRETPAVRIVCTTAGERPLINKTRESLPSAAETQCSQKHTDCWSLARLGVVGTFNLIFLKLFSFALEFLFYCGFVIDNRWNPLVIKWDGEAFVLCHSGTEFPT